MVKISCEICGERYNTIRDAKKCESQGRIGPEIKPGLIIYERMFNRSFDSKAYLFFEKTQDTDKHEREYHVVNLICELDKTKKIIRNDPFGLLPMPLKALVNSKEKNEIGLLTQDEFEVVSEIIKNDEKIQKRLLYPYDKDLYRYHEWFDKK